MSTNTNSASIPFGSPTKSNPQTKTLFPPSKGFNNLFPKSLDSSGYIILSTIAIICILFFIIQASLFKRILTSLHKSQQDLRSVSLALYIQQQLTEYRFLLNDLSHSITPSDKANARTQLYNHLNTIALEICNNKNLELSTQLAQVFFSKFKSRYLKLSTIPDGLLYFKYISQHLLNHPHVSLEDNLKFLRKNVKHEMKTRQETEREPISTESIPTSKKKNPIFFWKNKK